MKEGEGILYNMEKINEEFTYAQKDELVSYKGEFKNGLPHGRGQVWNKEDNRFYESEWA